MSNYRQEDGLPLKSIGTILGIILIGILALVGITKSFVNVDAREIVVVQHPMSGELEVYSTQGIHPQYWGTVTRYKKSFQYEFSAPQYIKKDKSEPDNSIRVRFNDGGHAHFSGSVRISLPTDRVSMIKLHTAYGSEEVIENQLIHNAIYKAVYMSAPLLSSKESSAEKRNDLINWISDQAEHGVYKTDQIEKTVKDQLSGESKTITLVEYQKDSTGAFARQEKSPLETYNIGFSALSVLSLDYETDVEKQIKMQQDLVMQVQTAIAQSKQAEQQAITTAEQGKANAAKAKWEKEALKAAAVTEAEQERDVAKLNADKEAFNKQAMILKGQGEGEYKRLVTVANNNFDKKAELWLESQKVWADAFAKHQGSLVPTYQMGNATGANGNAATNFMEIMSMKAMKDLNVDMSTK